MIDSAITALVQYAVRAGLLEACDETWAVNTLLGILELSAYDPSAPAENAPLHELLNTLTDDAVRRGVIEDGIASRDLFDTRLMGALTPAPREVRGKFRALYALSPQAATDWFYTFSQNTNYIRRDRIAKDRKWRHESDFGTLDITINRSKPEKDPRAIAAAKNAAPSGYPLCQLCAENEGYFGRLDHPARENHRIVPLKLAGGDWYLQYSPYVYYNEHCIVLNARHVPMQISRATFDRLLDFVGQFPALFPRLECGPAHRGRLDPQPRPFSGRAVSLCHGARAHRAAAALCRFPGYSGRDRALGDVGPAPDGQRPRAAGSACRADLKRLARLQRRGGVHFA